MTLAILIACVTAAILITGISGDGQKLNFQAKIYFGKRALIKDHPFQVLMINNGFLCSGSIIGSRTVLTAAHCIEDMTPAKSLLWIACVTAAILITGISGDGQKLNFQAKIYFGKRALIKDHPFQVLMINNGFLCSGSIIGSRTVLTAAHCIEDMTPAKSLLWIGTDKLLDKDATQMQVLQFTLHERYVSRDMSNDIGLTFLVHHVPFGPNVKKIMLSEPSVGLPTGAAVTVSGWGKTEDSQSASNYLLQTQLNYLNTKTCEKHLWTFRKETLTASMFCLVGHKQDACEGDSGGPVVYKGNLYGVVSFGYGCGTSGEPSVYTNISYFYGWIKKNMKKFHKLYCTPLEYPDHDPKL